MLLNVYESRMIFSSYICLTLILLPVIFADELGRDGQQFHAEPSSADDPSLSLLQLLNDDSISSNELLEEIRKYLQYKQLLVEPPDSEKNDTEENRAHGDPETGNTSHFSAPEVPQSLNDGDDKNATSEPKNTSTENNLDEEPHESQLEENNEDHNEASQPLNDGNDKNVTSEPKNTSTENNLDEEPHESQLEENNEDHNEASQPLNDGNDKNVTSEPKNTSTENNLDEEPHESQLEENNEDHNEASQPLNDGNDENATSEPENNLDEEPHQSQLEENRESHNEASPPDKNSPVDLRKGSNDPSSNKTPNEQENGTILDSTLSSKENPLQSTLQEPNEETDAGTGFTDEPQEENSDTKPEETLVRELNNDLLSSDRNTEQEISNKLDLPQNEMDKETDANEDTESKSPPNQENDNSDEKMIENNFPLPDSSNVPSEKTHEDAESETENEVQPSGLETDTDKNKEKESEQSSIADSLSSDNSPPNDTTRVINKEPELINDAGIDASKTVQKDSVNENSPRETPSNNPQETDANGNSQDEIEPSEDNESEGFLTEKEDDSTFDNTSQYNSLEDPKSELVSTDGREDEVENPANDSAANDVALENEHHEDEKENATNKGIASDDIPESEQQVPTTDDGKDQKSETPSENLKQLLQPDDGNTTRGIIPETNDDHTLSENSRPNDDPTENTAPEDALRREANDDSPAEEPNKSSPGSAFDDEAPDNFSLLPNEGNLTDNGLNNNNGPEGGSQAEDDTNSDPEQFLSKDENDDAVDNFSPFDDALPDEDHELENYDDGSRPTLQKSQEEFEKNFDIIKDEDDNDMIPLNSTSSHVIPQENDETPRLRILNDIGPENKLEEETDKNGDGGSEESLIEREESPAVASQVYSDPSSDIPTKLERDDVNISKDETEENFAEQKEDSNNGYGTENSVDHSSTNSNFPEGIPHKSDNISAPEDLDNNKISPTIDEVTPRDSEENTKQNQNLFERGYENSDNDYTNLPRDILHENNEDTKIEETDRFSNGGQEEVVQNRSVRDSTDENDSKEEPGLWIKNKLCDSEREDESDKKTETEINTVPSPNNCNICNKVEPKTPDTEEKYPILPTASQESPDEYPPAMEEMYRNSISSISPRDYFSALPYEFPTSSETVNNDYNSNPNSNDEVPETDTENNSPFPPPIFQLRYTRVIPLSTEGSGPENIETPSPIAEAAEKPLTPYLPTLLSKDENLSKPNNIRGISADEVPEILPTINEIRKANEEINNANKFLNYNPIATLPATISPGLSKDADDNKNYSNPDDIKGMLLQKTPEMSMLPQILPTKINNEAPFNYHPVTLPVVTTPKPYGNANNVRNLLNPNNIRTILSQRPPKINIISKVLPINDPNNISIPQNTPTKANLQREIPNKEAVVAKVLEPQVLNTDKQYNPELMITKSPCNTDSPNNCINEYPQIGMPEKMGETLLNNNLLQKNFPTSVLTNPETLKPENDDVSQIINNNDQKNLSDNDNLNDLPISNNYDDPQQDIQGIEKEGEKDTVESEELSTGANSAYPTNDNQGAENLSPDNSVLQPPSEPFVQLQYSQVIPTKTTGPGPADNANIFLPFTNGAMPSRMFNKPEEYVTMPKQYSTGIGTQFSPNVNQIPVPYNYFQPQYGASTIQPQYGVSTIQPQYGASTIQPQQYPPIYHSMSVSFYPTAEQTNSHEKKRHPKQRTQVRSSTISMLGDHPFWSMVKKVAGMGIRGTGSLLSGVGKVSETGFDAAKDTFDTVKTLPVVKSVISPVKRFTENGLDVTDQAVTGSLLDFGSFLNDHEQQTTQQRALHPDRYSHDRYRYQYPVTESVTYNIKNSDESDDSDEESRTYSKPVESVQSYVLNRKNGDQYPFGRSLYPYSFSNARKWK